LDKKCLDHNRKPHPLGVCRKTVRRKGVQTSDKPRKQLHNVAGKQIEMEFKISRLVKKTARRLNDVTGLRKRGDTTTKRFCEKMTWETNEKKAGSREL